MQDPEFARKDSVSHHILRFAYCSTEEQRRWFLTYESALFKFRAERESSERVLEFMSRYDLRFVSASEDEKAELRAQLRQAWEANPPAPAEEGAEAPPFSEKEEFYKVHFTQALDLLRNRSVFLRGGYAYVPRMRMVSALTAKFRAYVSGSLRRPCFSQHHGLAFTTAPSM